MFPIRPNRFVLTLTFMAYAWSQNMINYGAAAGGAAVGGATGRAISDNINSIFSSVDAATPKAVAPKTPAAKTYITRPATPDFSTAPGNGSAKSKAGPQRARSRSRQANPDISNAPANEVPYALKFWVPVGLEVQSPTPEQISQVKIGEDVENLGIHLGVPANQVVMPGADGRLWQRIKYKNAGRDAGVIYVADGKVVEILPAIP